MANEIKILLLEDNPSDADLIQQYMKRSGLVFTIKVVQTCEVYEKSIEEFRPDIILSDFSLPSFDGITAFHIKQEVHRDVPFIIVSGTIGEEKAVELIKMGVDDYASKDNLVSLGQKINRALKETENRIAKRIADQKLKLLNEKLFEIAFLQSHQVRVPVTQIIGLFSLFNFENPSDPINAEVLNKLKESAESLDNIIREIVKKTNEIKAE
jgi:DNA-binding NtrC family response regulator